MRRTWTFRVVSDERGQAILFAAASVMVLAGFVALVFNLGQVGEQRVRVQLAADGAAYSGGMVQANALSTIAWINDGMGQIYTNLARYAVDVCTTGVVAELENRLAVPGAGAAEYSRAVDNAREWLPRGKEWMAELSRIQNAIALVTPRLMQETMYQVAKASGAERISIYPTARLFPHEGGERHFRIEQFPQGWRITNLDPDSGEVLWVFKRNNEWHIVYSQSGVTKEEIVIIEVEPGRRWVIRHFDGAGKLLREVTIIKTDELGWIVLGSTPQNPHTDIVLIFTQVDMDGDGTKEGTRVEDGQGHWQVFKRDNGMLYLWNKVTHVYDAMTTQQTTIGGIPIKVNVTNVIQFPGATVTVGDPTSVTIGRAHILLSDPPTIETGIGPVHISVRGFDAGSFSISVNGFVVNVGSSDGRWRKYYDPEQELWWRHRLTEERPMDPAALRQWQYDYQLLGAHLRQDPNAQRFFIENGLRARIGQQALPVWTAWFDVTTGQPQQLAYRQQMRATPEPVTRLYLPVDVPPADAYYRTLPCTNCGGSGYVTSGGTRDICTVCNAQDHDGDGASDVRIFLADVSRDASGYLAQLRNGDKENYMRVRVYEDNSYNVAGRPGGPLVVTEEFFKYGINVAAWRDVEAAPMLFKREPAWGFVAVASARIGLPVGTPGNPTYVYQFDVPGFFDAQGRDAREQWVEDAPENLYRPALEVRLVSSRRTVDDYDLEHIGTGLQPTAENGVSYLWDALMLASYSRYDEPSTWLNEYDGRTDRRIPGLLSHMNNRRGAAFDLRDPEIENLIYH